MPVKITIKPSKVSSLISEATIKLENAKQEYRKTIRYIEQHRPHDWKYESDPSGNNDSGYICKFCRKDVKRLP